MARFPKSARAKKIPRRNQRRKKNPYIIFYMTMLHAYPSCAVKLVAKKAGELWNSMSPCEKELYRERARQSGNRTCRGCQQNTSSIRAPCVQDSRSTAGRSGCVRETTAFKVHPAIPEERCVTTPTLKPHRYTNTATQPPGSHGRYRYVSMSEHCGCSGRAPTPVEHPTSRGVGGGGGGGMPPPTTTLRDICKRAVPHTDAKAPSIPESLTRPTTTHREESRRQGSTAGRERRCSCGKMVAVPKTPQSPTPQPAQMYNGVVLKRRCRCGIEYEIPIEEMHLVNISSNSNVSNNNNNENKNHNNSNNSSNRKKPCQCGREHHHGTTRHHQHRDEAGNSRCTCVRKDGHSANRHSKSRSRREDTGSSSKCPHSGKRRSADKSDESTSTNRKRHYSDWYT